MSDTFVDYFLKGKDPNTLDFYNINLKKDIRVGLDPSLFNTRESQLGRIRISFNSHFEIYRNRLWKAIKDDNKQEVKRLIKVSESPEVGLGYSVEKNHHGAGVDEKKANKIINNIWEHRDFIIKTNAFSMASIYVKGLGLDTVSDITVGVLKRDLIDFTQIICRRYSQIKTEKVRVFNIYDISKNIWSERDFDLPINPKDKYKKKNGIILIPKYFIRGRMFLGFAEFSKWVKREYRKQICKKYGLKFYRDIKTAHVRDFANNNPKVVAKFEKEQNKKLSEKNKKGDFKISHKEQNI